MLQKVGSQSMLQLASILDPTWLHFGRVLAPEIHPSWHQIVLNIDSESDHKNGKLLDRLNIDLGWIWGPKWPPNASQRLPSDPPGPPGGGRGPSFDRGRPDLKKGPSWEQKGSVRNPILAQGLKKFKALRLMPPTPTWSMLSIFSRF